MSKLSRPGGLEGLFGNGSDTVGILASGPESPRQVGVSYDYKLIFSLPNKTKRNIHSWLKAPLCLSASPLKLGKRLAFHEILE